MRARLPAALSLIYDTEEIEAGRGTRPGEQRQHVFDFEDGVRCILSLDAYPAEKPCLPKRVMLHMSFSSHGGINFMEFFNRVEAIPAEFWPDTVLLPVQQFMTPYAVHVVFDIPRDWKRFYEVSTPKTASSAG